MARSSRSSLACSESSSKYIYCREKGKSKKDNVRSGYFTVTRIIKDTYVKYFLRLILGVNRLALCGHIEGALNTLLTTESR
jgi:hypothetical protein